MNTARSNTDVPMNMTLFVYNQDLLNNISLPGGDAQVK